MDSTMIGQECIDELADFVGLKPQIAAITERAMRGELDFEPALRERVALLKDSRSRWSTRCSPAHALHAGRPHAGPDHEGTRRLLRPGFGRLYPFHRARRRRSASTRTGQPAGQADGRFSGPSTTDRGPCREARHAGGLRERGLGRRRRSPWATAPTTSPMMAEAGLGVAFHAKPAVAAAAGGRRSQRPHRSALPQGYAATEFVG